MNVLVTGAAGYIGSHAVKQLKEAGHHVVALDNLERGHHAALEEIDEDLPFEELDLAYTEAITNALVYHRIECVMHFAALAYVGESVEQPLRYYNNNVAGTVSLLQAMEAANVRRMVFSSTCATYGEPAPDAMPLTEDTPQRPINPYGRTKLAVEWTLRDLAAADERFAYAALRYFNVAGCAADGSIGEHHDPETHLIPLLLQVALEQRESVTIFGDDYDTPDGTCVRDYIHVEDLVAAHIRAMEALDPREPTKRELACNLGIGRGHSVKEIVEAARRVTGHPIPTEMGPRRPGDPPQLYADSTRAQRTLNWQPRYTDIDRIIETAWRWFKTHPDGYVEP